MSRIKLSNNKFLSPGDAILRKDLHKYLGGSGQGGINPSSKSSSILIFTDPTEGAKHGYNDGWNKGIFEYFGSGQKGNMELKKMNKSLLNHVEEGRRLFLFNGHRGEITYENEFTLYERDPYFWTVSTDKEGKLRDSIVFRLKPVKKYSIKNPIASKIESVSRTSFEWGIKIPDSPNHIMYVWIDALTNYLTSIGYPDIGNDRMKFWEKCIHIIGKDILKFHAVYWPAMLMSINFQLPKSIFAHGWWTNEGKKISKSLGNSIDPNKIIDDYGLDQFKYFLLREVPLGNDGDFSEKALINRINSDLANNLGNLIQRVTKFLYKNFNNTVTHVIKEEKNIPKLQKDGYELIDIVREKMESFEISKSLEDIFLYIDELNKFVDDSQPWKSFKIDPKKAGRDLSLMIECFRIVGIILQAFIPDSAKRILDLLKISESERNFINLSLKYSVPKNHQLCEPNQLFPRYEK